MTSRRQISLFTEDESTLLPEGSPVNPTQAQAKDWGKMTSDISGPICLDAFGRFPRVGLWGKTFSDLLIGQGDWFSRRCNLIWRLKGTKYNRIYFQLYPKTLRTEEIEAGLLPTPMAQSRETDVEKTLERKEKYGGMKRAMYLENYAAMGMLPTPTVVQDECGPDMWDKRMKRIVAKGHNSFTDKLEVSVNEDCDYLRLDTTVHSFDITPNIVHQSKESVTFSRNNRPPAVCEFEVKVFSDEKELDSSQFDIYVNSWIGHVKSFLNIVFGLVVALGSFRGALAVFGI